MVDTNNSPVPYSSKTMTFSQQASQSESPFPEVSIQLIYKGNKVSKALCVSPDRAKHYFGPRQAVAKQDSVIESAKDIEAVIVELAKKYNVDSVVCSHYLGINLWVEGARGASIVAALYDKKIPGVLIAHYDNVGARNFENPRNNMLFNYEIRTLRQKIPCVITTPPKPEREDILKGITICKDEIKGKVLKERSPCEVEIEIARVSYDFIGIQSHKEIVWFPSSMLPDDISRKVFIGQYLSVISNPHAELSNDLFFYNFKHLDAKSRKSQDCASELLFGNKDIKSSTRSNKKILQLTKPSA